MKCWKFWKLFMGSGSKQIVSTPDPVVSPAITPEDVFAEAMRELIAKRQIQEQSLSDLEAKKQDAIKSVSRVENRITAKLHEMEQTEAAIRRFGIWHDVLSKATPAELEKFVDG